MMSLESFTITGSNEIVKVGDSVFMRCSQDENNARYMARVWSIKADDENGDLGVKVDVKMYYLPEDTFRGRGEFYGIKELLSTNHFTTVDAAAILQKINVHSFVNYMKLKTVGEYDFFFRFEYEIGSGSLLSQDPIEVYCKCRLPFNPDVFMLECEACKERYHPACINMTTDEAKKLYNFTCDKCPTLSMLGKLEQQLEEQSKAAEERKHAAMERLQAAKERQQAAEERRAAEERAQTAKERQKAAEERETVAEERVRAAEERVKAAEERAKDIANMMKTLKPPHSSPPS